LDEAEVEGEEIFDDSEEEYDSDTDDSFVVSDDFIEYESDISESEEEFNLIHILGLFWNLMKRKTLKEMYQDWIEFYEDESDLED